MALAESITGGTIAGITAALSIRFMDYMRAKFHARQISLNRIYYSEVSFYVPSIRLGGDALGVDHPADESLGVYEHLGKRFEFGWSVFIPDTDSRFEAFAPFMKEHRRDCNVTMTAITGKVYAGAFASVYIDSAYNPYGVRLFVELNDPNNMPVENFINKVDSHYRSVNLLRRIKAKLFY